MKPIWFQVRPRYTPGSPAQVPEMTARQVAEDERRAYARTLEGAHGTLAAEDAQRRGLEGIAEQLEERAEGWIVTDLITAARCFRAAGLELTPRTAARLGTKYRLPVRTRRAS